MRRVLMCALLLVSFLLNGILSVHSFANMHLFMDDAAPGAWPHAVALPLHSPQIRSPPVSSPPSITNVAYTSSLISWQTKLTNSVHQTRLRDLHSGYSYHQQAVSHTIPLQSSPNFTRTSVFLINPLCSVKLQYTSTIKQGELLPIYCFVNSSLDNTTTMNLTLFHPLVGSVTQTNLLLVRGENLFHLDLDVLPACPAQTYNLTFLLTTPEVTLSSNQISLTVDIAFVMMLVNLPEQAGQNQPFEVRVSVTNLGSQSRVFNIIAESTFRGNTQVIVQPNETRLVTLWVEYASQAVTDIGVRIISLVLIIRTHRITSIETSLYIGYSTVSKLIIATPPIFLFVLCIIGIQWLRKGKRSSSLQPQLNSGFPLVQLTNGSISTEINQESPTRIQRTHTYPLTPQLQHQLQHALQQLGLTVASENRHGNNRVVLAWETKGKELHIVLEANNSPLINRVLGVLADEMNSHPTEGEHHDT